jgi:DNA-binding NtrC family response regulator
MTEENPIHVLLVDDEERFRFTTARALGRRGFHVETAPSGAEAIEEISRGNIDVVVLDVRMPGMDGHRTLREILKRGLDVAVIMLTAFASMDSALEALRDEVFAYLPKPCDIELLTNRIREAHAVRKARVHRRFQAREL